MASTSHYDYHLFSGNEKIDVNVINSIIQNIDKNMYEAETFSTEEQKRAVDVENKVIADLDAEIKRASSAEKVNASNISAEASRAKGIEQGLRDDVNALLDGTKVSGKATADAKGNVIDTYYAPMATVTKNINAEKTRATKAESDLQAGLTEVTNAVSKLNSGETTEGSVAYQIAQIVNANNNGKIDTLKEIADWIANDKSGAAKMSSDISALQTTVSKKANDADISKVGKTGNYSDLKGLPSIPSKVSDLTNDSKFVTQTELNTVKKDLVTAVNETNTKADSNEDAISDIVNTLGAKNLLNVTAKTTTRDGVTFTVNADNSITVNGTATANTYCTLYRHDFGNTIFTTDNRINNSDYVISGLPTNNQFYLVYDSNNHTVNIVVKSGYTVDNVTIYPMIRPKHISDDTYVPYSKTNQQLTDDIGDLSELMVSTNNRDNLVAAINAVLSSRLNRTYAYAGGKGIYDSKKPYKVGEYVGYSNNMYKCITPCSAASWDVNKSCFEIATLTEALNDAVDTLEQLKNYSRRTIRDITNDLINLPTAVAEQNLEKYGYTIGDYFVGASKNKYVIADMNPHHGMVSYNSNISDNHIGVVVYSYNKKSMWYTSESGTLVDLKDIKYIDSTYHKALTTTLLDTVKSDFITLFGGTTGLEHLIPYSVMCGKASLNEQYISALSEIQVYGSNVYSGYGDDTGDACKQLSVFNKIKFSNYSVNWFCLRNRASTVGCVCNVSEKGSADKAPHKDPSILVGLILFK